MKIVKSVEYYTNVEVTDFITGQTGICSLKAVVTNDVIQGYICGIKYEQIADSIAPEVKTAYDNFITEIQKTL